MAGRRIARCRNLATKYNRYSRWDEKLERWVVCNKDDEGAEPDLNWANGVLQGYRALPPTPQETTDEE